MTLPMGYFDDEPSAVQAVMSERKALPTSRVNEDGEDYRYEAAGPVEGPGWDWSDEDEGEERLRTLLRSIDRTARGLVTPEATLNAIRLATCKAMIQERVDKGLPIPTALTRIYDEVREGRFK